MFYASECRFLADDCVGMLEPTWSIFWLGVSFLFVLDMFPWSTVVKRISTPPVPSELPFMNVNSLTRTRHIVARANTAAHLSLLESSTWYDFAPFIFDFQKT